MGPEDEDLDELPPLDGESRDEPEPEADEDLDDGDEDATLDDTTDENTPVDTEDLDLVPGDDGWLNEPADAQDLDLGDLAITDFGEEGASTVEADDANGGEDELVVGDAPERGGLDAGDEGPLDADEELNEADLPALDSDEEGELDDAAVVDARFGSDDPHGIPWATRPWSMVRAPLDIAGATALAWADRGALVAARSESGRAELIRVDLEGAFERLPARGLSAMDVRALAVEGPLVGAVMLSGQLFLSRDGGEHFAPAGEPIASDARFAAGRLWVLTRAGGLMVLGGGRLEPALPAGPGARDDTAGPPDRPVLDRCPVPGIATALSCDHADGGREAAVLVVDDGGRPAALLRTSGDGWARRDAREAPEAASPAVFAARGEHVAYAARRGGVVRAARASPPLHTGEASDLPGWERVEWDGRVTCLAFIDDQGTLVASTYSESDDTTTLVRLAFGESPAVVARLGATTAELEPEGVVSLLAYDEAHDVVWVAGGFGVAAFATK